MRLFRRVATAVGTALGYAYLRELDECRQAHLDTIRHLPLQV